MCVSVCIQFSPRTAQRKHKARKDPGLVGLWFAPSSKFPCMKAFQEQHTDPRYANTFERNHFRRNINFIKETAKPGKKNPQLPLPPNPQRELKWLSAPLQVRKRIKDFLMRARLPECLQVPRAEVIFFPDIFCRFVVYLKGRGFSILHPSKACGSRAGIKNKFMFLFCKTESGGG